ncbi:MAG: hypothetical protein ABIN74_07390 [Ferruginibacter sp.]
MEENEKDWKLKLRYGKLKTPYKHFTILAEGEVDELDGGFECPKGNAFMGMKIWAKSIEGSSDVYQSIAEQIGFKITGNLDIFDSAPEQPPSENPSGYDINFTPFQKDS